MATTHIYKAAGLLLSAVILQGCQQEIVIKDRKPLTVMTVEAQQPISNQYRSFKGTVVPADLTPLSFRVEGELEAILVRKGQKVQKGELLAKLDSSKLRQQLADAQARYELAVRQQSRGRDLLKRSMVSQSEYDELTASKRLAEVEYQVAKNNLEYTRLIAPFDGYVSEVPKESFENASPGEEILSIYRGDIVRVRIAVSDIILATVNPDDEIRDYPVKTTFLGNDKEYTTVYYEHSSEPAEGGNTFEMSVQMPQVEPAILPGTSANLSVDMIAAGMRITQGYQVPMTALDAGQRENEFFIWKVLNNTVHKVPVEIIQINNQGAIVEKGVQSGDIIVNSNLNKMRENAVVALADKED